MEELSQKKRVRDDSDELELDSPEVKRLREDLLDSYDESELCTTSQDLDSFMKSFEEELSGSGSGSRSPVPALIDLTSESRESGPVLGYLLEASDDELGLPPSTQSPSAVQNQEEAELVRVLSEPAELSELWKFDDDRTSGFDTFDLGCADSLNCNGGEYVALDGLFDYSDLGYETSEFLWRPETLPAQ